jgi:hypothetical protein
MLCLARAFDRFAHRLTMLWCDGEWKWPIDEVPEIVGLAVQPEPIAERAA